MGLIDSYPERYIPRDPISGNVEILEPEHGAIHDGVSFMANHQVTVGTGTAVTVLIVAPATAANIFIHFSASVESDKAINWTFSEAPNASGGSAVVSYNKRRKSTNTSGTVITHTVTYTSAGTILEQHNMGTNSPTTRIGGDSNSRNEWMLAPGQTYLLRVVAAAATTIVNINIPYYYRTAD